MNQNSKSFFKWNRTTDLELELKFSISTKKLLFSGEARNDFDAEAAFKPFPFRKTSKNSETLFRVDEMELKGHFPNFQFRSKHFFHLNHFFSLSTKRSLPIKNEKSRSVCSLFQKDEKPLFWAFVGERKKLFLVDGGCSVLILTESKAQTFNFHPKYLVATGASIIRR